MEPEVLAQRVSKYTVTKVVLPGTLSVASRTSTAEVPLPFKTGLEVLPVQMVHRHSFLTFGVVSQKADSHNFAAEIAMVVEGQIVDYAQRRLGHESKLLSQRRKGFASGSFAQRLALEAQPFQVHRKVNRKAWKVFRIDCLM